ncbi:MAG: AmmeMemoRadiSam system protein B [Nitrospirae bacterium]|nr:AmmeMemoRadiSam system protein B [Nitrospirota bacterium]MCL5238752.1 AmmeMemoRadiSam system protein B [Nitrospirota bacterium]
MRRPPVVAGRFYDGTASKLKSQVGHCIIEGAPKEKVIGVLSPHAGLMYSGHVAGAVYSSISFPETFIILGPNHTNLGARASIMASGEWEIPARIFSIDSGLSRKIMKETPLLADDAGAHEFEHSIEVQLPFISYFSDTARIVPITFMSATLEECGIIGEGIARAVRDAGYEVVIVASSDMSHYVPDDVARKLDGFAVNEMLKLNPEGLFNTVTKQHISMCGFIPSTIMLYAAGALGAREARLVKYATSGDTGGDYEHVVGYAGILVK